MIYLCIGHNGIHSPRCQRRKTDQPWRLSGTGSYVCEACVYDAKKATKYYKPRPTLMGNLAIKRGHGGTGRRIRLKI